MTVRYRTLLVACAAALGSMLAAGDARALDFTVRGEISSGTCQWAIGDGNHWVTLDPIRVGDLRPGSQVGGKDFKLQLTACSPAVRRAVITFSGQPDLGDGRQFRNIGQYAAANVALNLADDSGNVIAADGSDSERSMDILGAQGTLQLHAGYFQLPGQVATEGLLEALAVLAIRYE